MKKTALLVPLALLLVLAAGTSQPAASLASLETADLSAPMAVMLQDEAKERATLGAVEVHSEGDLCEPCLMTRYDCQEAGQGGLPCGSRTSGCLCLYCGTEFSCYRP